MSTEIDNDAKKVSFSDADSDKKVVKQELSKEELIQVTGGVDCTGDKVRCMTVGEDGRYQHVVTIPSYSRLLKFASK